jgi:hypothetical protein
MAEEALVKEFLTENMVRGGEALTRKLDELGWPVVASFWYFEPDDNRWKLMIASPKVNLDGPKEAYEAIQGALSTLQDHFTDLQYITVVQPDHPIVQTLAAAIPTGPAIVGMRFSQNTINGRFIDDAYLYRVNPSPVAA